jgi:hypothetical protein
MELILSTGTVYGQPYYTVHPSLDWVISTEMSNQYWRNVEEWCINTFGKSGTQDKPGVWSPYQKWYYNDAKFWFKEKKDLEWFILKWA